jgi:uncharacterized membrane protein (DUF485 family)
VWVSFHPLITHGPAAAWTPLHQRGVVTIIIIIIIIVIIIIIIIIVIIIIHAASRSD